MTSVCKNCDTDNSGLVQQCKFCELKDKYPLAIHDWNKFGVGTQMGMPGKPICIVLPTPRHLSVDDAILFAADLVVGAIIHSDDDYNVRGRFSQTLNMRLES